MHIPVDWGNHNWRMLIFVWRFQGITITYKTTDECDELNCTVQNRRALVLPSSERTQQIPRHSWRWFSNSQGGICEFPWRVYRLATWFQFQHLLLPGHYGRRCSPNHPLGSITKTTPPPSSETGFPRKLMVWVDAVSISKGATKSRGQTSGRGWNGHGKQWGSFEGREKSGSSGTCLTCPTVQIYPVHPGSLTV